MQRQQSAKKLTNTASSKSLQADTNKDVIQISSEYPDVEAHYPVRILTAGGFHNGEIDPKSDRYKWKGLFKSSKGYYVSDTEIKLSRDTDILDEPGEKTGWLVTPTVQDTVLVLVSGLPSLSDREVQEVKLSKNQLLPGEQQEFSYKGIKYILYATGKKMQESPNSNFYNVVNYKLMLKATVNGQHFDEVLISVPRLTDTFGNIDFVGDLDGDAIPDLILDTSSQENVATTTLYLSKQADQGKLLNVVGLHLITGC